MTPNATIAEPTDSPPSPTILAFRPGPRPGAASLAGPPVDEASWRRYITRVSEEILADLMAIDPSRMTLVEAKAMALAVVVARRFDLVRSLQAQVEARIPPGLRARWAAGRPGRAGRAARRPTWPAPAPEPADDCTS